MQKERLGENTTAGKLDGLAKLRETAANPGTERAIERQREKGKMTARERIEALLDDGTFVETDRYRTHRSYNFGMEENRPLGDGVFGSFPTRSQEGAASPKESGITTRKDGSLLLEGLFSASEMRERLGLSHLPNEDDEYQTVGGMMMSTLRNFPSKGDSFDWSGWSFEVVDMDGYRVDKVLATRISEAPESH